MSIVVGSVDAYKPETEFPRELAVLVEQQLDKNYVEGNRHTFKADYLKKQLRTVIENRNQLLELSNRVDRTEP